VFHVKLDPQSIVESLSSHQIVLLRVYESFLATMACPKGFVSETDQGRLWDRHILDSLRALQCLGPNPISVVDVGSGAGLPGVPIAIARPDSRIVLLEAKARRAAFLEFAVEQLGLANARVVQGEPRATGLIADVATARALAPPRRTWEICGPAVVPRGVVLYFAGSSWSPSDGAAVTSFGVDWEICADSQFPWQGPIVKMMRQLTPGA
jgi:16S rRNA (guanine527-N7)-methyltransferase